MTSRERVLAALSHTEPDTIPIDMGSTQVTGIAVRAYDALRKYIGMPSPEKYVLCDVLQQLAQPDDDFVDRLGIDIRGLFPLCSNNWNIEHVDAGDHLEYVDEWGMTQSFPKEDGLYYSVIRNPLDSMETSPEEIAAHNWPDTGDARRIEGLADLAREYRESGKAVVLKGVLAGIFEMAQRIRGMENCLVDLIGDEPSTCAVFDKMLELKIRFWETALPELGNLVDVVAEGDDYGTQTSQLMSPELFRKYMKPRLSILFSRIRKLAPDAKIFFHSCGSIREILPDLIEAGVDIINPVHIAATGMEPRALKRDFGNDIVFWGGGVDTQGVLPGGTPQQVRDDVRRNIDALAPGGGYVFNTVHNIQTDVPPENVMAMFETIRERS